MKRLAQIFSSSRLVFPNLLACGVGIGTGLLAVGFIFLINWFHHLFFTQGSEALHPLGALSIVLIPVIGGLLIGPMVTFLAPEAKGHGIPQVLKAIALKGGRIRPVVVVVKALASAIAIGSGASVGREGPIVQAGSALGSTLGQIFKLNEFRLKNLVACGAAAGIAAVFNAPIAGVMFASEVILRDFGARALSTVVIAAVSSSVISRIFLGVSPAFFIPAYTFESSFEIFIYLGMGVLAALTAHFFMLTLHSSEAVFERWKFPEWLKPAVGGLFIGCLGLYVPQIFGTGFEVIENALHGSLTLGVLLMLVFAKVVATSISLGSGSSGGVFAPALFIGAVLGGSVGKLVFNRLPFPTALPGAYAVVGMASVFAAAAHAPVTAILIVFEMTGDYKMILPIMIAVVTATSVSQLINRESIYTAKLKQQGIDVGLMEEVKVLGALRVEDAMSKDFEMIPNRLAGKELVEKLSQHKDKNFFVIDSPKKVIGFIGSQEAQTILLEGDLKTINASDAATPLTDYCFPEEALSETARFMLMHNLNHIPVVNASNPNEVVGVLKTENIFRAYTHLTGRRSDLVSVLEQGPPSGSGTLLIRFVIPARSPIVGKLVKELNLPERVVLTSIQRGRTALVPEGETIIKVRDRAWAVAASESEPAFKEWLKNQKLTLF